MCHKTGIAENRGDEFPGKVIDERELQSGAENSLFPAQQLVGQRRHYRDRHQQREQHGHRNGHRDIPKQLAHL